LAETRLHRAVPATTIIEDAVSFQASVSRAAARIGLSQPATSHALQDSDALAARRGHPMGARLKRRDTFLNARHVAVIIRG
jgi:hypothetical protein